jgi:hypothetical protein
MIFESPIVVRGALISLIEDTIIGFTPNIVFFQYNPSKLTRSLEVHSPQTPAGEAPIAPGVQPLMPRETIELELELDASDARAKSWPLETAFGVATRIAALEKMTMPSKGLLGDLVESVSNIAGAFGEDVYKPPERQTVPVSLFIWGPARFSPVRVTSYSIEEQLFSPFLYPLQAKVSLSLEVIPPEAFRCKDNAIVTFSKAFYELNRMQQDALAIANLANAVTDVFTMVAPP